MSVFKGRFYFFIFFWQCQTFYSRKHKTKTNPVISDAFYFLITPLLLCLLITATGIILNIQSVHIPLPLSPPAASVYFTATQTSGSGGGGCGGRVAALILFFISKWRNKHAAATFVTSNGCYLFTHSRRKPWSEEDFFYGLRHWIISNNNNDSHEKNHPLRHT